MVLVLLSILTTGLPALVFEKQCSLDLRFGGGNEMTQNLIFNMVRETLDHGPFNSVCVDQTRYNMR